MFSDKWSERRITDDARHILEQVPTRAIDRGLGLVCRYSSDSRIQAIHLAVFSGHRQGERDAVNGCFVHFNFL